MHEIAATQTRFTYRRACFMLKPEGWDVGKHIVDRVHRVLQTGSPQPPQQGLGEWTDFLRFQQPRDEYIFPNLLGPVLPAGQCTENC